MPPTIKAIYHSGTFILQTACDLPEGVEVELLVQSTPALPPKISNTNAREDFLRQLVEKMQHNPIPSNAPRFTRDMLYESR
ncbi:antitoxin family protein [Roseofilum capinflatum]|uniref:Antitoxin family protein n=1 Tax=Roseofilum capinflatum BLCC-M114 TaxID=3022440 RepID=A0ABT7B446_9CYAN|nr:antitoxin family protein [Roseofilum capinflatum]MDJ1173955.1 antitoxin family protein [Roseofilum capinflatum BLCC-M114]